MLDFSKLQDDLESIGMIGSKREDSGTVDVSGPLGEDSTEAAQPDDVTVEVEWLSTEDDDRQPASPAANDSGNLQNRLLNVQEAYLKGDPDYGKELPELLEAAIAEGNSGNSCMCEILGATYLILDPGSFCLTREVCVREAMNWYFKAANDIRYMRRGSCGMQIARLSYRPKFRNVDFRQAAEWFEWAAAELAEYDSVQVAEACMELGRISEYGGKLQEAVRWWKKADGISGDNRGKAEQGRMQIVRGLDPAGGLNSLKTLAAAGDTYAAIVLVELIWTFRFPQELNDEVPYDELPEILERAAGSSQDAKAALAGLKMGENDPGEYQENIEREEYYVELRSALSHDSMLASYFLGKCFTRQLGYSLDGETDMDVLPVLADKAIMYLKAAADEGYVPAIKDFVLVNSTCFGFDGDTAHYCDLLDLYGEGKYADSFREDKDNLNEDKLFAV